MTDHEVVSREDWAAAREELLAREKEHTHLGDELAQRRRELPWVRVEKEYRFDTDDGTRALAILREDRAYLEALPDAPLPLARNSRVTFNPGTRDRTVTRSLFRTSGTRVVSPDWMAAPPRRFDRPA